MLTTVCLLIAVGFVLTAGLGLLLRGRAGRWGLLDGPGDPRKRQRDPIPAVGGIAIVACTTVLAVGGWLAMLVGLVDWPAAKPSGALWPMVGWIGGAVAMTVLGVIDDRRGLSAGIKLLAQLLIAAFVVVVLGLRVEAFLPVWLASIVSVLWIVTLVNAINFMDNTDGLATGLTVIVAGVLIAVGSLQGQLLVPLFGAALLGATLGFLPLNWPRASAYLGDGGSLPLGFLLAVLTMETTYFRHAGPVEPLAVATPLLVLAVPLYDLVSTLIRRRRAGEPLMRADRRHFAHRLQERGLSAVSAVGLIWMLTLTVGLAALLLQVLRGPMTLVPIAIAALVLAVVAVLEFDPGGRVRPKP